MELKFSALICSVINSHRHIFSDKSKIFSVNLLSDKFTETWVEFFLPIYLKLLDPNFLSKYLHFYLLLLLAQESLDGQSITLHKKLTSHERHSL